MKEVKEGFARMDTGKVFADSIEEAVNYAKEVEPHVEYRRNIGNIEVILPMTNSFLRFTPIADIRKYINDAIKHQGNKHGIDLAEVEKCLLTNTDA